jgi:hypothetical protein
MWQLPAVSVTAQSFLYSQGVAATTSGPARILVALIGLVTAVATARILIQCALHNEMWRSVIDASRAERRAPSLRTSAMHAEAASHDPGEGEPFTKRSQRSRLIRIAASGLPPAESWLIVLVVFALGDLAVLAVGITQSAKLWAPF